MKVTALKIEADTNEFGFTPGVSQDEAMRELMEHKNKFNENFDIYEEFVNNTFRMKQT